MNQTQQAIENLAEAFSKGLCPKTLYVTSLESLVRMAISEYVFAPVRATKADLKRVVEILAESRLK